MLCFPVMLRGRCSCAIPTRPTSSPSPKFPLSPIIPVHPGHSPVSPIIPVHTQKQGGGGCFFELSTFNFELVLSDNSFLFFRSSNHMVNYMINHIVGAPTFLILARHL